MRNAAAGNENLPPDTCRVIVVDVPACRFESVHLWLGWENTFVSPACWMALLSWRRIRRAKDMPPSGGGSLWVDPTPDHAAAKVVAVAVAVVADGRVKRNGGREACARQSVGGIQHKPIAITCPESRAKI